MRCNQQDSRMSLFAALVMAIASWAGCSDHEKAANEIIDRHMRQLQACGELQAEALAAMTASTDALIADLRVGYVI